MSAVLFRLWLAALLLLAGNLRAEAMPADHGALSALEAVTVFCHAGHDHDGQPLGQHHVHETAVLQVSPPCTDHVATLAAFVLIPVPSVMAMRLPAAPQARAPPRRLVAAASARGPPRAA